ncbi:hypothetical protein EBU24_01400 [bacterium]|nr:hypothetical protein [bacterium]
MASLALLVSIIFCSVLVSGPLCYLLSTFKSVPSNIIYIFSTATICLGLWWFFLPIPSIRYIGLFSVWLGWLSIKKLKARETQG